MSIQKQAAVDLCNYFEDKEETSKNELIQYLTKKGYATPLILSTLEIIQSQPENSEMTFFYEGQVEKYRPRFVIETVNGDTLRKRI